jgi:hypothetical protein
MGSSGAVRLTGGNVKSTKRDPAWSRRREAFNQPLPATFRWVETFPEAVRPVALLHRFPRIANLLARVWNDEARLHSHLDSLLTDRRNGRQGFPPDVHNELLTLRELAEGRYPATPTPSA